MNEQLAVAYASVMGIVPSFGLLWAAILPHEGKFNEKDVMMTFIIGLFAGVMVVVIHLFFISEYIMEAWLYPSAIILGMAEIALYRMYMKRSKFKGRTDLPFLGLSFGLGISGTYILYLAGRMFFFYGTETGLVLGMILFAVSVPLVRGAGGLIMARGIGENRTFTPVLKGGLILGAYNIIVFLYVYSGYLWTFALACVGLALISYALYSGSLKEVPMMKVVEDQ